MQGQKNRQELEHIGKRILGASRDELYLSMRFLDSAFAALPFEMNLNTRVLATDGEFLYFNPAFLMKQYREEPVAVNRAFLHSVLHCVFRHAARPKEQDAELWDLACDIAVEELIDSMEDKSVRRLVSDERTELYGRLHKKLKVLSAEGIYHCFREERLPMDEQLRLEKLFYVDDHSFFEAPKRETETQDSKEGAGGQNEAGDGEQNGQQNENRENTGSGGRTRNREELAALARKWKQIGESMKTNLETFSARAGRHAGGLLASLTVEYRETYDYPDFLRKFTRPREELRLSEEEFDTAFYTYGLSLYGNLPLVEPLEYTEENRISELVIVIDTSGSCQADGADEFLRDTFAVLNDSGLFARNYRVRLLQSDVKVHSDVLITSAAEADELRRSFRLYGGGGTDFRAAFEYVAKQRENGDMTGIQGLLYFTDGYGTFPEERPDYDTAFLFWRSDYEDIPVPAWAYRLLLKKQPNGGPKYGGRQ